MLNNIWTNTYYKICFKKEGSNFSKSVISTFLSQVILLLLSILTAATVARWLGPEGKGTLAIVMLVPGILRVLLSGGIGGANVYFAGSRQFDVSTLITNSINYSCISTSIGITLMITLIFTGWLEELIPGVPIWAILLSLIVFPVGLISGFLGNILQGQQRFQIYNLIALFQGVINLIFILIFVDIFKGNLLGAILSYLGTSIISLIILLMIFYKENYKFFIKRDPSVMRTTLIYGLKGHIGNILQYFNYRIDIFIVNFFLGPQGVGIYSVSVGLAELLWNLPNAVSFVIFPKAAATKPDVMNAFTPRVFKITLGLTALGAIFLIILGKPLIGYIYSPSFLPSYAPMLTLLPGVVLLGGAKVLTNEIAGRGYPHYNSVNSGIALILTVILDLILIPRYGVIGAAMASSISYSVIFFLSIGFYSIVSRKKEGLFKPQFVVDKCDMSIPT